MRTNQKTGGSEEGRNLTKEILDVAVHRQLTHRLHESYTVLNEIVVDRGPNPSIDTTSTAQLRDILTVSIE